MSRLGVAALFAILGLAYGATVADPVVTCTWDDCDAQCGGGNRVCQRSDGKTWNIDCHKQDCAPVTGCGYADIVFVLDASTSIGEKNWWKAKQFVIDVCKGLTVGPDESRVAVVIYSNKGHTMWDLSAFGTMAELEAKIWEIEYIKGNTNTYEGLLFADWVFGNTSRKEYKNIAIVLSDGEANNKKDLLPDQCQKLHDDGVEVFAVGISKEANMDEIRMIASEPKETHARNVSDYSALTTIVNEIIDETCEAATKWRCDPWTDWTKCLVMDILNPTKCGVNAGVQSRARTCYYYTVGGTVEETHIFTETKLCDVACSAELCARCTYNVDGIGYLPHDNCHQFIKCQYTGEGKYLQHEMVCPENQFWRQSILSCDVVPEQGYVCDDTPVVRTTTTTTPAPCQFSAHPTEKNKYIWRLPTGDVEMPCGYGTIYSDFACGCVHGGGNDQSCSSDTLLHFPFNVNTDDICNRAKGTVEGNVTIADNAAYFNGNSKVLVGFLKNWFAENPTNELTLSLWFKYLGDDGNFRGLFGNGDCKDDDSLMLAIGGWIAQGQVRTDFGAAHFDGLQLNMGITKDDWTLLTLVKTSWNVKYYINGVEFSSISLSGDVANTQIPATIGSTCGKWNDQLQKDEEFFFNGFIDDVRIYTKVLWDSDIQTLNSDGRQ